MGGALVDEYDFATPSSICAALYLVAVKLILLFVCFLNYYSSSLMNIVYLGLIHRICFKYKFIIELILTICQRYF